MEIIESYRQFDQKNNMIMRPYWDETLKDQMSKRIITETRIKQIEQNIPGYTLEDYALIAAAGTIYATGSAPNRPNAGLLSWKEEEWPPNAAVPKPPKSSKPVRINDLPTTSSKVKKVAKYFGADCVGIANLDQRWLFSHHYFPETGESTPVEIPEDYKYVVAMGMAMDYTMMNTAPAATAQAEVLKTYSEMAILVSALAKFIRRLGYDAIPSLNDTALNVPIAIDAGLGQVGRHGMLISPDFGPRIRLCKVITNLPMKVDKPNDFGVTEFCENCVECARSCPAGAIPFGERTFEGSTMSNNAGVLKWYLDAEKCRRQWGDFGTACGICIKVCPFNESLPLRQAIKS